MNVGGNMVYTCKYKSLIGDILLAADEIGLTGLWFEGQKYFANTLPEDYVPQETKILTEAKKWLDVYFSGEEPKFTPPLHPVGSTFRQAVWQILLQIPYGQTITYGEIARRIAVMKNTSHMSAQAVGGAVGHNEISIIIPCHRVVGTNGSLTGYAGGIDKKISLLKLEHTDMSRLFIPKKLRDETKVWLIAINRESGYLFLNRFGERITTRGISQQLKNYAEKNELNTKVVYPHSFRHRFAKNFLEKFNDISLLADLMGHESIETTRIYLRRTALEQQEIVDKVITW